MKDHSIEDVKEKISVARGWLGDDLVRSLDQSLSERPWEQSELNELFHALRKLEKQRSDEERTEAIREIKSFVENQS